LLKQVINVPMPLPISPCRRGPISCPGYAGP
jgi:hypothetical protein